MNILRSLGLACLPLEADQLIPPGQRIIVREHLACAITLRNFSSPGRVCNWKRQWFAGSIAISGKRFIAFRWKRRLINMEFEDTRFSKLRFSSEQGMLRITHDADLCREDWSGSIEYRFRTTDADQIVALVLRAADLKLAATN
ncbi:hypothetical protein SH139x_001374 [Planctomycetaceae bacterium SH139]